MNKKNNINNNNNNKIDDNDMILAINRTGIKVTNRGQWLRDQWNARGFVV